MHGIVKKIIHVGIYGLIILYLLLHTAVDCGPLDPPMDGSVTLTGTVFGSVATYSCNDGFRLEGEETRECQANSLWSGRAPTCTRKYCIGICRVY